MQTFNNEKEIKAYRFVKFSANSDSKVETATTGADNIIGISDSINSNANDIADISINGEIAQVEAGGAFSAGDALTCDSEGRAIKASSTDNIGAIAHQDASAEGDIVRVIVNIQRTIVTE